jgi:integrase
LRRSEIDRLEWNDVDLDNLSIVVRRSKSDAGTGRRIPIAAPLVPILKAVQARDGKVCTRSVMSGKLAARARKAWAYVDHENADPEEPRDPPLDPIGLHEARHTYASLLVAAHYTLKEVMAYMGHADLATTSRYVKMLPQPDERNAADRLNKYLRA